MMPCNIGTLFKKRTPPNLRTRTLPDDDDDADNEGGDGGGGGDGGDGGDGDDGDGKAPLPLEPDIVSAVSM